MWKPDTDIRCHLVTPYFWDKAWSSSVYEIACQHASGIYLFLLLPALELETGVSMPGFFWWWIPACRWWWWGGVFNLAWWAVYWLSHLFSPSLWNFYTYASFFFCSISSLLPLSSVCPNPSLTRQPLPLLSCYLNSFAFSSPLHEDLFLSSHGPTHKLTHPCKPRICKDRKCSHCIFAPGLFHVTQ